MQTLETVGAVIDVLNNAGAAYMLVGSFSSNLLAFPA